MTRIVTLAIVDPVGDPLGVLPAFEVTPPQWQETASVTAGALERFGLEIAVLRLLAAERRPDPLHGKITYLAQADRIPVRFAGSVDADLSPHPLRVAHARPDGPAATLAWARAALGRPIRRTVQTRTSAISAIWRLETDTGPVWLKQVPPLLAHEPVVLRYAADRGAPVPALLAEQTDVDGSRLLLGHVDGADLEECSLATRLAIAAEMHALQRGVDAAQLVRMGVPDSRSRRLSDFILAFVARQRRVAPAIGELAAGLPERLARVEAAGVPATLVHGDLKPGNVRGDTGRPTILDWSASVGHPAFDILRLADGLCPDDARALFDAWSAAWRRAAPGSDPATSIDLLRPVYGLHGAAVFDQFIAHSEPSEHPYFAPGIAKCIAAARLSLVDQRT